MVWNFGILGKLKMMRKVEIVDSGDTKLLEKQLVNRIDFMEENDWIFDKKYIENKINSPYFIVFVPKELKSKNQKKQFPRRK